MEKKVKVIFRADGNATIGLGHVIRSLALAEMLSSDFECHFMIRSPLPSLKEQILSVCEKIIELPTGIDEVAEAQQIAENHLTGDEIIVLDGYNFKTEYQRHLKSKGSKLVAIDDIHAFHFLADVIINHAGGVVTSAYSAEGYIQFCLGLKYALLRKPFRAAARKNDFAEQDNNIFICFGGADPKNDTLNALTICEVKNLAVKKYFVVIGAAYQHKAALDNFLKQTKLKVELLSNLSAEQMAFYMKKCKMAITPPSSVSYEYLSIGGELYTKVIASNQNNIQSHFLKTKLVFNFDDYFPKENKTEIAVVLAKQKEIFDGKQAKRLLKIFKYLTLDARKATTEDCQLYFDWANDPATRSQSFSSEPIPYENHERWFSKKIKSEDCKMYVMTLHSKPIGQIRFEIKNRTALISYSLDKNYRGAGYGESILRKGIVEFKKEKGTQFEIVGFVKMQNIASSKAFKNLDFNETLASNLEKSFKYTLT